MRHTFRLFYVFLIATSSAVFAQESSSLYATMDLEEARQYQHVYDSEFTILSESDTEAAVYMTSAMADRVRAGVTTHGSGYIFRTDEAAALLALQPVVQTDSELEYTITEDAFVNICLDAVNQDNIEATILELESYGTRYHTTAQAEQAVLDMQAKWDAMIANTGRTDIATRIFTHRDTPMPSLILTINGADTPDEYVIIGGHIDSTSWNRNDAPGADDNASGIASITEMIRVLLANDFQPARTVEIMAYAAEEIGLVGSEEIARSYRQNNVNVLGYVQFDMTGYKGSVEDVYVAQDSYNSVPLTQYLVDLMNHYNASGDHSFTYGFTVCGYGCSDHASWATHGYDAAFPFEATFEESNPRIHSPEDVYSYFNTPEHAAKFTKLGMQYLIEAAKTKSLGVEDVDSSSLLTWMRDKQLFFELKNTSDVLRSVTVYSSSGRMFLNKAIDATTTQLDLSAFSTGVYIVNFETEGGYKLTKKIVLR